MRGLAFRRHSEQKRKAWAKKIGREWYGKEPTDKQIGRLAHTRELCSCHMCGNPRKHFKQKTLQELKADHALVVQLAEATDSNPVQCEFESHQGHQ